MDDLARLLLRSCSCRSAILPGCLRARWSSCSAPGRSDRRSLDVEAQAIAVYGYAFAAPVLLVILLSIMWLPAAIGVLLAETFALRSWMFHAGNGAVSAWVAWNLFGYMDNSRVPLNGPASVIAAGLAGGLAYWAIAGWNAGFWRPLFRPGEEVAVPPPTASRPPQIR